jgi:hypothetical protein
MAALLAREDLGGNHLWIPGARVADSPQQIRFPEAGRPELIEEGAAFFGSGDSCEPVLIGGSYFAG